MYTVLVNQSEIFLIRLTLSEWHGIAAEGDRMSDGIYMQMISFDYKCLLM